MAANRASVSSWDPFGRNSMIKVGIFGASGYTGIELLKILRRHPHVTVVFGTSESSGGQKLSDIYPTTDELELVATDAAPIDQIDLAFLCLPHMAAQEQARKLLVPKITRMKSMGRK